MMKETHLDLLNTHYELTPARPDDAAQLNRIRAAGWRQAYQDLPGVTETWLERQIASITSDESDARRRQHIKATADDGKGFYRVARARNPGGDRQPVGFVDARREYELNGRSLHEVHTLQVVQGHQQRGLGAFLLQALEGWLEPARPVAVEVAALTPAVRFYERHDFVTSGCQYGFGPVLMAIMVRPPRLSAAASRIPRQRRS